MIQCYWCVEFVGGPLDGQIEVRDQTPPTWESATIMPTAMCTMATQVVRRYAYYELDRTGVRDVYRYLGSLVAGRSVWRVSDRTNKPCVVSNPD